MPDWPLADHVRATVRDALQAANLDEQVTEVEGDYASPILVIDGFDVGGRALGAHPPCSRLHLPTKAEGLTALMAGGHAPDQP